MECTGCGGKHVWIIDQPSGGLRYCFECGTCGNREPRLLELVREYIRLMERTFEDADPIYEQIRAIVNKETK